MWGLSLMSPFPTFDSCQQVGSHLKHLSRPTCRREADNQFFSLIAGIASVALLVCEIHGALASTCRGFWLTGRYDSCIEQQ